MRRRRYFPHLFFDQAIKRIVKNDSVRILIIFILYRLVITIFSAYVANIASPTSAFVGQTIFETHQVTAPSLGRLGELFILPWFRWDTGWYLKIAALGYSASDGTIIFPPLYPLLIRTFALLLFNGNYLLSGLFVSNVLSAIALILFFQLTKKELGAENLASRSIIYLVAYPAAFYLTAAYSESTYLVFAFAAWLSMLKKKWIQAGIFAGIASLARLQGWLLAVPFLWFLISNRDSSDRETPMQEIKRVIRDYTTRSGWIALFWRFISGGWAIIVLPPLSFWGYSLWLSSHHLGSIPQAYNKYWDLTVVSPWMGLVDFIQRTISGNLYLIDWVDLILVLVVILVSFYIISRLTIGYSIYVWIIIALVFMRGYSTHLLPGFNRYSLTLFPIFWVLPHLIKNFYLEKMLLILSISIQFLLLWMFLNWYWVA